MAAAATPYTALGPYLAGEIPEPWAHQFNDANGAPIPLAGFTARISYRVGHDGAATTRPAVVSGPDVGVVRVDWEAADFATAGVMHGELTVGNGVNRYARSFLCLILPPRGGALPTI